MARLNPQDLNAYGANAPLDPNGVLDKLINPQGFVSRQPTGGQGYSMGTSTGGRAVPGSLSPIGTPTSLAAAIQQAVAPTAQAAPVVASPPTVAGTRPDSPSALAAVYPNPGTSPNTAPPLPGNTPTGSSTTTVPGQPGETALPSDIQKYVNAQGQTLFSNVGGFDTMHGGASNVGIVPSMDAEALARTQRGIAIQGDVQLMQAGLRDHGDAHYYDHLMSGAQGSGSPLTDRINAALDTLANTQASGDDTFGSLLQKRGVRNTAIETLHALGPMALQGGQLSNALQLQQAREQSAIAQKLIESNSPEKQAAARKDNAAAVKDELGTGILQKLIAAHGVEAGHALYNNQSQAPQFQVLEPGVQAGTSIISVRDPITGQTRIATAAELQAAAANLQKKPQPQGK